MEPFAWLLVALNVVMAAVYIRLGRVVARRRPTGSGRLAASAFAAWWFLLGLITLGAMANLIVVGLWSWSLPAYLAYFHLLLLAIVAALAALMYYLVFLFTGRRAAWIPIFGAYGAYYGAIVYYLAVAAPSGISPGRLGVELEYANDLTHHWSTTVLGLLLIVPPLVAAVAYFSLFFRVPERSQKFRIGAVGGAFALWFGASLAVSRLTDWGGTDGWRIGSSAVALAASSLVYIAFQPPPWLQRRFRLTGFGQR